MAKKKAKRAKKDEAAAGPKPVTFVKMPDAFTQHCKNIMGVALQQARRAIEEKIVSARQLRKDLPDDWIFDMEMGGFRPRRAKEKADG